jgi:Family of unknown function (DUF6510)
MDALDGNAIAGHLAEVFGLEMTTTMGTCTTCGAIRCLAEVEVYLQAPGIVARCRSCRSVVIVLVTVRGVTCVDLRGIELLEPAREQS